MYPEYAKQKSIFPGVVSLAGIAGMDHSYRSPDLPAAPK